MLSTSPNDLDYSGYHNVKTESNNCFLLDIALKKKKNKERQTPDRRTEHRLTLLLEIMHWGRNLARVVQTLDSAIDPPDKSLFIVDE